MAWLADQGQTITCCRNVSEEEYAADEASYDCDTCELRIREGSLSSTARRALLLYGMLALPVVRDFGLVPMVFDIAGLKVTLEEAHTLLEQLDRIHEVKAGRRQINVATIDD